MSIVNWLRSLFLKEPDVETEPEWPDELWARMYALSDYVRSFKMGDLDAVFLDTTIEVTTASMHQLFRRIEVMIHCLDTQNDPPDWWGKRNREKVELNLAEYYFDKRNGYAVPQEVLNKLTEKVAVIHHLLASQQIDERHDYYHYMKREFFQVVSDIVEVLQACLKLGKPE